MADMPPPRPVQVFLDTKRFIELEETHAGGGSRDFFEGDNRGFAIQKEKVRTKIRGMSSALRQRGEPAGFIRVQMRDEALGKSYRPIRSLFTESHGFALVGAGRIGEMVFQTTPERLDRLDQIIDERAEVAPRREPHKDTGELVTRVSGYRSEVGAIADIGLHDGADRVQFTAEEAVAWLKQSNTVGGYLVELFRPNLSLSQSAIVTLAERFRAGLEHLPSGVSVRPFLPSEDTSRFGIPSLAVSIQLLHDRGRKEIALPLTAGAQSVQALPAPERSTIPLAVDLDVGHHRELLSLLRGQALVRSVELPPLVEAAPASLPSDIARPTIPGPVQGRRYPVVGIIDGGVADIPELRPWCVGDAGLVPEQDRDTNHGTFIAGLVVAGHLFNPHLSNQIEPSGCKFFDLDLFPRRGLRETYYGSDIDTFFDLLDEKIKAAKRDHSVRIFNLSFGLRSPLGRLTYNPITDRLDRLARANDIILVVSAGNLQPTETRPTWSTDASEVVTMLANSGADSQRICPPAEHLLGLTVGAVNPPGVPNHAADVPTTYTRRGPGIGGARKPDLAHYGGAAPSAATGNRTGLASFAPNGEAVESCGTSYASPNVAATLATLDDRLEHAQNREILLALTIHRAKRSKPLSHKALRHISREFVGFGLPPTCDALLLDDPHAISLVFSETLLRRQKLEFPFAWPAALVADGGICRGEVEVTLVYTPPIDSDFKDEAQRVQMEAHLAQESIDHATGEISWGSRLAQDGSGVPPGMNKTERYLVRTGLKWSPIKRYELKMPQGRGNSSNWKLTLDSLTRAGAHYPVEGVPFALILTIFDGKRAAPIHDEVRNGLRAQGFTLADITVAHRVRQRSE